MTIRAQGPDGQVFEFPDGTPEATISRAVREHYSSAPSSAPQRSMPRTSAETNAVQRGYMLRNMQRETAPLGLGYLIQPLSDMVSDPRRRTQAGNAIGGAAGWLAQQAQQPLDLPRLGRDTMAAGQEAWNNLPSLAGNVLTHLPQVLRGMTYGPAQDAETAAQDEDLANVRGDNAAANAAASRANAATVQNTINMAAPFMGGGNAVRAGVTAAAVDAPFALARQEGNLQERLPGALTEIGGVGMLGAGLQRAASALPATRIAPRTADIVDRFEQANVPPIFAAARGQEAAPMTMAIAENPIGGNVRANLARSAAATGEEANRLAGEYAPPLTRESAGETIQSGIQRWANPTRAEPGPTDLAGAYSTPSRLWSFDTKANTLYENVTGRIQQMEDAALGGAGQPRIGAEPTLTVTSNAQRVLNDIVGSVRNQSFRQTIADPQIVRFARLINDPQGRVHFGDLRAFRTYVRGLQENPQLRQGMDDAGLQRLEEALTQDISQSASNIGGPQAAHVLNRVDTFYRAGQQRIQRALQPFRDARSPASAYERIIQLASDNRAGANTEALLSLKRTLRPDEMRSVQATLINRMGRVRKGAADALEPEAFSIENFTSNYADMSPAARRILFGSRGGGATEDLAAALDNLAYVAGRQKNVRGFTNYSRSGSSVQNVGTLALAAGAVGRAFMGDFMPAVELAAGAVGMRVMGEALTNPRFVRWMVGASRTTGKAGSLAAQLPRLAVIAAADPAVAQVYNELAHPSARQSAPPADAAPSPRARELQTP